MSRRIGILEVVFSNSRGGLEMLAGEFSGYFKNSGFDVTVIHPGNKMLMEKLKDSSVENDIIKPWMKYLDIKTAAGISQIIKKKGISVIHCHISRDLSTLVLAKLFAGAVKPGLIFTQHMDSRHPKNDIFHRWIYRYIDKIFTISNDMRNNQLLFTPAKENQVECVYNGVDLSSFGKEEFRQDVRRKYNITKNEKVIGTVGRIDRLKDQELLIRSAPFIIKEFPETKFMFVGDETDSETGLGYLKFLKDLSDELGVAKNVIFVPFTPDISKILSIFDIFVLTSKKESFGLVVIEAMASGKPVIGTDAGGVPEIIADGETGYLFPPGDSEALTINVIRLLKNPDECTLFGLNGRRRAENLFDFNKNMEIYCNYFRKASV